MDNGRASGPFARSYIFCLRCNQSHSSAYCEPQFHRDLSEPDPWAARPLVHRRSHHVAPYNEHDSTPSDSQLSSDDVTERSDYDGDRSTETDNDHERWFCSRCHLENEPEVETCPCLDKGKNVSVNKNEGGPSSEKTPEVDRPRDVNINIPGLPQVNVVRMKDAGMQTEPEKRFVMVDAEVQAGGAEPREEEGEIKEENPGGLDLYVPELDTRFPIPF